MGLIGKIAIALSVSLVASVFPFPAEAQLAKSGTYASHFPWQGSFKAMPLAADHTLFVYETTGTFSDRRPLRG